VNWRETLTLARPMALIAMGAAVLLASWTGATFRWYEELWPIEVAAPAGVSSNPPRRNCGGLSSAGAPPSNVRLSQGCDGLDWESCASGGRNRHDSVISGLVPGRRSGQHCTTDSKWRSDSLLGSVRERSRRVPG
jgi:hypothetical protein